MSLRLGVDISGWIPSPSEFQFLLNLLAKEEAEECTKFRFQDDKNRALISRLLQRYAAHKALQIPHSEVVIKRTRGRKPYVANNVPKPHAPNFNFSVSHEGAYVILAAEPLCITGCDVAAPQQLRRRTDQPLATVLSAFRKQLTPAEWTAIQALSPDEPAQEAHFQQLWSLKESYVKATGEGLAFDLGLIEFCITAGTATVTVKGQPHPRWTFHLHQLGKGHWASVARAPPDAIVDAWGGFTATLQQREVGEGALREALAAPEPPFTMLTVSDLVPAEALTGYEEAGGDVL